MAQITVKLSDGSEATYIKPDHCLISDTMWQTPLGYCWAFASRQDDGEEQCTKYDMETCGPL